MDMIDILHSGNDNTGGLFEDWYYADVDDVDTWPSVASNPATPSALMETTTDFVMKTGKKFLHGQTVLNNGEVKWELVGPRGGKCYKHTLECFVPENSASKLGVISLMKNRRLVIIGKDRQGILRIVGSESLPATLDTAPGTTGKSSEDSPGAGNVLTFMTESNNPPLIYKGDIPLTPAA